MLYEIPYHYFSPLSPSKSKMKIGSHPPTSSTIINFTIPVSYTHLNSSKASYEQYEAFDELEEQFMDMEDGYKRQLLLIAEDNKILLSSNKLANKLGMGKKNVESYNLDLYNATRP